MVFSSLLFLFRFLPIVLLFYYVVPKKMRNFVLFIFSVFFYAWGEPVYVVLIIFSTLLDYVLGRVVGYYIDNNEKGKAKLGVCTSAVINLMLLLFFKYGDFVLQNISLLTGVSIPELNLGLPIGISFYTFQTMSYTIDVYRQETKVQKNIITFGAYVSLFPQLIAGPIVRYKTVAEQLDNRKESLALFSRGVFRFVIGLGKKVLIANQVGELWNQISTTAVSELSCATAWLGAVAFSLQIYFDFSGYSDMAIGLGKMFGFEFLENFNYPYESKSITEFWRRWHISLGTWFREYVYIPLGGNKKGLRRQLINISIVWLLTGLWHGANWFFVAWGVYYGIILLFEKCFWKYISKLPSVICRIYTLFCVIFGWAIFAMPDVKNSKGFFKVLFNQAGLGIIDEQAMFYMSSYGILLIIAIIGSVSFVGSFLKCKVFPDNTLRGELVKTLYIMLLLIACICMIVNSSYNPFLYFRF